MEVKISAEPKKIWSLLDLLCQRLVHSPLFGSWDYETNNHRLQRRVFCRWLVLCSDFGLHCKKSLHYHRFPTVVKLSGVLIFYKFNTVNRPFIQYGPQKCNYAFLWSREGKFPQFYEEMFYSVMQSQNKVLRQWLKNPPLGSRVQIQPSLQRWVF